MNTRDRIEARVRFVEASLYSFRLLASAGNAIAEGCVAALEDELRWLKWVLEDME